jgi:hypothetical protein
VSLPADFRRIAINRVRGMSERASIGALTKVNNDNGG